jgi:hypothetical protein
LDVAPSLQVTIAAVLAAAAGAAAGAGAVLAAVPADLLTPPWPLHAPRPPLELEPSLQVTAAAVPREVDAALVADVDGVAAGAGAAAADLLTPPWPLHAPRPPLELEPSLHVTLAVPLEELLAAGAGPAAGGAAAVVLPLVVLGAVLADLLTPPWPLHAPRPPLELEPSLQVTWVASCAETMTGIASSAAASSAPDAKTLMFATFICSSPREPPLILGTFRILQSPPGRYRRPRGGRKRTV